MAKRLLYIIYSTLKAIHWLPICNSNCSKIVLKCKNDYYRKTLFFFFSDAFPDAVSSDRDLGFDLCLGQPPPCRGALDRDHHPGHNQTGHHGGDALGHAPGDPSCAGSGQERGWREWPGHSGDHISQVSIFLPKA